MPAWRLDQNDRQITRYDVGAKDGGEPHFVEHVVLCDVDVPTNVNTTSVPLESVHMVPPLTQSAVKVAVIGIAELDAGDVNRGERRRIKSFIDDRWLERKAQEARLKKMHGMERRTFEYVIHPAGKAPDSDYPLWRFNCAGFVLDAYLEAGIELIDQVSAPSVNLDFLKRAYPILEKRVDDSHFRKAMGIDNGDSWPVIMAGYVIHSLNRSADEIRQTPYNPRPGDECFPAHDH